MKCKCPAWRRDNAERWRIFEGPRKPELTEAQKTLARKREQLARVIERVGLPGSLNWRRISAVPRTFAAAPQTNQFQNLTRGFYHVQDVAVSKGEPCQRARLAADRLDRIDLVDIDGDGLAGNGASELDQLQQASSPILDAAPVSIFLHAGHGVSQIPHLPLSFFGRRGAGQPRKTPSRRLRR